MDFGPGFSVVTGDTGAGKSVLLDALRFVLGTKPKNSLVRTGCAESEVIAAFDVGEVPREVLDVLSLGDARRHVRIQRIWESSGRTRAYVNDLPCSISRLKMIGEFLVDVHGQNGHLGLMRAEAQRDVLDLFGGLSGLREEVATFYRAFLSDQAAARDAVRTFDDVSRDAEFLSHVEQELRQLAPAVGEERALSALRAELVAAERVQSELLSTLETLDVSEADYGALAARLVRSLARHFDEGAFPDGLVASLAALDAAQDAVSEVRRTLEDVASVFLPDQARLNAVEERLFALRSASRKFARPCDCLAEYLCEVEARLALLEAGDGEVRERARIAAASKLKFIQYAERLSVARQNAARELSDAVMAEFDALSLAGAQFLVQVQADDARATAFGIDCVQFLLAANRGGDFGPLSIVASGGELSRIALAIKLVCAGRGGARLLVFDEADAGIGGAVADRVGGRLALLAEGAQALVITHSPQVAARGDRHFRLVKHQHEMASTEVVELSMAARREEIARMLSGAEVTDAARAAASALLAPHGRGRRLRGASARAESSTIKAA